MADTYPEEYRLRAGFNLQELQDASGVLSRVISGIERGAPEPKPMTLKKIAKALGVSEADYIRAAVIAKRERYSPGQTSKKVTSSR